MLADGPGTNPIAGRVAFENLTGDPGQDYWDGVTDVTTDLAQVAGLRVISRTSSMQYKHAAKVMPVIGQELDVDAVLEGAIVRTGDHVRITAQLIHAKTDRHLWARSYEGELGDMVALQRRISRGIVTAIDSRLILASPIGTRVPPWINPQAYDAYLRGLSVEGRGTDEGFQTAVAYFEDAVSKQPDFAGAYAAMARSQLQLLYVGSHAPRETIPKAEAAARRRFSSTIRSARSPDARQNPASLYWKWKTARRRPESPTPMATALTRRRAPVARPFDRSVGEAAARAASQTRSHSTRS